MSGVLERLRSIADDLVLAWGWRANALAFGAGALFASGLPPFDLFFMGFVAFPVLVLLMDGAVADELGSGAGPRFRRGFVRGWWFGMGYFLLSLWWVATSFLVDGGVLLLLLPFAMVLLPIGLAIFTGFGTGLATMLWHEGAHRLLLLAGFLGATEWLRGTILTGFPWNLYGMPAMMHPVGMQSASAIGIYGVTLIAILVFSAPVLALREPRPDWANRASAGGQKPWLKNGSQMWVASLAVALAVAHVGFGIWRLSSTEVEYQPDVALRVVQPNLNQADKWRPELADENFSQYLRLSDRPTSPQTIGAVSFTHIIWPETAFPFVLTERPDALVALAELLPDNTMLLTGAVRRERPVEEGGSPKVYNTVYGINGSGEIIAAQDKVRLVPFGEFIPFGRFFDQFGISPIAASDFGFTAGAVRQAMTLPGTPALLPLICYEVIFPNEGVQDTQSNAPQWILNVTNDAWFGATPGPHQHLRHAQIRAASEGVSVIRAANTGISAIIDPLGRITNSLPLGEEGTLDSALPKPVSLPLTFREESDNTEAQNMRRRAVPQGFILAGLVFVFCMFGSIGRSRPS
ncbi:MAG: apolipoprotein N-acyltransferase [Pseudomonadota bacterium]